MIEVRLATTADAEDFIEIYSPNILSTAISFETEIPTIENFKKRIEKCLQKFPWIVCSIDNKIAGYVYASSHRDREAYQWSCECSVYVHENFQGKKIGKELYHLLFKILKHQGFRNVYAGITLPNDASVQLHEKCGFENFATYENVGYKFGKWHSVGWWKLQIKDYDLQLPPPLKISQINPDFLTPLFQSTAHKIQSAFTG